MNSRLSSCRLWHVSFNEFDRGDPVHVWHSDSQCFVFDRRIVRFEENGIHVGAGVDADVFGDNASEVGVAIGISFAAKIDPGEFVVVVLSGADPGRNGDGCRCLSIGGAGVDQDREAISRSVER